MIITMKTIKKILNIFVACFSLFMLFSCGEDNDDVINYELNIQISELTLDEGEEKEINISYTSGATLVYDIEGDAISFSDNKIIALKSGESVLKLSLKEDSTKQASIKVVVNQKVVEYKIEYIIDDEVYKTITFTSKEEVTLEEVSKDGYTFDGWYEGDTLVTELTDKNYTLVARFSEITYTIICLTGGDCVPPTIVFSNPDEVVLPIPEREGSKFVGWYEGDTLVTSVEKRDYILNAKWIVEAYKITYVLDQNLYKEDWIKVGELATEYYVTKEDDDLYAYNFFGWCTSDNMDDLFDFTEPLSSNVVVYAVFEQTKLKQEFKVYYYNEKNSRYKVLTVKRGECAEPIDCPKEDSNRFSYEVEGWYTNMLREEKYDFSTKVYSDLSLYVKYNSIEKDHSGFDLTGKRVSFLGDSVTTFYSPDSDVNSYYSGDDQFYFPRYSPTVKTVDATWWYKTYTALKMKLVINESLAGSCMTESNIPERIRNLGKFGKPDVIIINLGINDNVNGKVTEYKPAYERALKQISELYPDAYVFLCTLGYSAYTGYSYTEETRLKYNNEIKELAETYHCGLIRIDEVQTSENYFYYLGDNLHPNIYGMEAWAKRAILDIKEYFK